MRYIFEDYAFDTDRRELHRGSEVVSIAPQVFDLLRLPDPQQGARRQQRRPHRHHLERAYRVRCSTDDPSECRPDCDRRFRRGTAPHQNISAQGSRFIGPVREAKGLEWAAVTDNRGEPPKPALTLPDKPSIAVLSFANLSSDPEQEYFADENVFRKGFAPCQSTPLNLYTVNLGEVPQRIFEVPHRKGL